MNQTGNARNIQIDSNEMLDLIGQSLAKFPLTLKLERSRDVLCKWRRSGRDGAVIGQNKSTHLSIQTLPEDTNPAGSFNGSCQSNRCLVSPSHVTGSWTYLTRLWPLNGRQTCRSDASMSPASHRRWNNWRIFKNFHSNSVSWRVELEGRRRCLWIN